VAVIEPAKKRSKKEAQVQVNVYGYLRSSGLLEGATIPSRDIVVWFEVGRWAGTIERAYA
jgi:hypothetical protein